MKGLARSLDRAAAIKAAHVSRKTIKVDGASFTVDGATGVGDGQLVIGDFPAGNILFLGAVAYMAIAGPGGDAGLVDTWSGDYSIGTTADSGDDLSGADADIVGSTAIGPAVAEAAPRTRGTGVTQAIFDNTDGSLEINLNVLVDDANISADGIAFTATGELYLAYAVLGDD